MINISVFSGLVLSMTLMSTAGAIFATTSSVAVPYFQSGDAAEAQTDLTAGDSPEQQLDQSADIDATEQKPAGTADGYDLGSSFDDYEGRYAASGYNPRNMPIGLSAKTFSGGWTWSYVGPCSGSNLETIMRGNNGQIYGRSASPCQSQANPTFVGGSVPWDVYTKNAYCGYGAGGPATAYRAEVMGMVTPWIPTPSYQCEGSSTPAPQPAAAPTQTPTPEPSPEPSQEPTPTPTPTSPADEPAP